MKPSDLIVLLPCYSLEDLSLDHPAAEAEEILASWCGLYHPALLATAEKVPRWVSAESAPSEPDKSLITVPTTCDAQLPARWFDRAAESGAGVVRGARDRLAVAAAATKLLGGGMLPPVDPSLVRLFFSLAFCHLQVELLTRQLRYMSNLDEDQFARKTLGAAEAAVAGDEEEVLDQLRSAFDLLTEAREYFYPVEAHLLDLTLVASTTLGESLRRELDASRQRNILISGELVEELARREPQSLAALREGLEAGRVSLVGGGYREEPLGLLTHEAILADLQRGLACYQRHLGHRPKIYGRRSAGLTPLLPQILHGLGFVGALHFTLDVGRFPASNQSKVRWEGIGGKPLEALGRVPFDVTSPDNFLRLPERLGDAMDLDHAASTVLAHWAGHSSPWYEDLQHMGDFSPVLGRFNTVDQYFSETELAGQIKHYGPDQYRTPYLSASVERGESNPLSRWVELGRISAKRDAAQTLSTMQQLVAGGAQEATGKATHWSDLLDAMAKPEGLGRNEPQPSGSHGASEGEAGVEPAAEVSRWLADATTKLGRALSAAAASPSNAEPKGEAGLLVLNPWLHTLQGPVDVTVLERLPAVGGPVRWAAQTNRGKHAVVETPSCGFSWVAPAGDRPEQQGKDTSQPGTTRSTGRSLLSKLLRRRPEPEPPLAELGEEGCLLRNEFFRIKMHPHTGTIQAIHDYHSRGNRLAQQIAFYNGHAVPRDAEAAPETAYTIMAVDSIHVEAAGPEMGEVVSRGRLVSREGKRVADFQQTTRVRRGSRIIELDIELDPHQLPTGNPWGSYYAVRFAWDDATADTLRNVGLAAVATDASQIEAPCFFDIRSAKSRATILTGGLPFHRRVGLRKLDTLLVVSGEESRSFRLGIGIDLDYPLQGAAPMLMPGPLMAMPVAAPAAQTGWLFHIDAREVMSTHWEPLVERGRCVGFRVRLLETEGRRAVAVLRCLRPVASARQTDFLDQTIAELPTRGDRITMELKPHQWIQVEARWQ